MVTALDVARLNIYVVHMNITGKQVTAQIRQQIASTPGLSISGLAAEIGMDRTTLGHQLNGGTMRLPDFLALASALDTDPADYLESAAEHRSSAAA